MKRKSFVQRHPLAVYFSIVFLISWGGGAALLLPKLARGVAVQATDVLLLFPILVIGVGMTGLLLTSILDGKIGIQKLFHRIALWRMDRCWYAAILLPPGLILLVLLSLRTLVSSVFAPHFFPLGFMFGLFPGFFEEIGWTGYAFPRMLSGRSPLAASLWLGILWGLWHLPVVDYLGAAAPHGAYWLPFFLAFIALVTAVRVLIAWAYTNTHSLLLAQLMHASSTAFLVVLGPVHVTPSQEVLWYTLYAVILWAAVAIITAFFGAYFNRRAGQARENRDANPPLKS